MVEPVGDRADRVIRLDDVDETDAGHHEIEEASARSGAELALHRVSVVVPARNEVRNIGWVLDRVPRGVGEVILVDGNSDDGTVERARQVWPDIVVVTEDRAGKGGAMLTGFAAATRDYVVALDGDGSMDPREIIRFVTLLADGFDVVKGSRFMTGGASADITRLRHMGNFLLRVLVNVLHGSDFSDLCYGYVAIRRDRIRDLDLDATGFEIEAHLLLRAWHGGLSIAEIPSFEAPRRYGESSLRTFKDGFRILWVLLREFAVAQPRRLRSRRLRLPRSR